MPSERHRRLVSLYKRALAVAPAERRAWIESSCDDPSLVAEALEWLELVTAVGDSQSAPAAPTTRPDGLPERIGPYRILDVLGEGGMGRVYVAEQENPKRRVALKVLRPGIAISAHVARFVREAQVLARFEHSGIAQIFEAGSADTGSGPQPWFAMELLDASPLTDHADANQLDDRTRLELIAQAAEAVHHAHERGIVHRDLKPANMMVTKSGVVKILDFGIARVLDDESPSTTIETRTGQILGTLPYMSPEQVRGDSSSIDRTTDVYSLGVVAFELLTSELPLDVSASDLHRSIRHICEDEPKRLSSIRRTLRGDIETIVGKALEKEPARRYASAGLLAADVRRYLSSEPILARPASTFYQLRKFAGRHPALVSGLGATFALLVFGIIAVSLQARATERARVEATRQARAAEAVRDFLVRDLIGAADPREFGTDIRVIDILDASAAKVDKRFAGEPELEGYVRNLLSEVYLDLGRHDAALEQAEASCTLYRELKPRDDRDRLAAEITRTRALVLKGRIRASIELATDVLQRTEATLAANDRLRIQATYSHAFALYKAIRPEEALAEFRRGLELAEAALPPHDELRFDFEHGVASALLQSGKLEQAEAYLEELYARFDPVEDRLHPDAFTTLSLLAEVDVFLGRDDRAIERYDEVIERASESMGSGHAGGDLVPRAARAVVLARNGRRDEALTAAESALHDAIENLGRDDWLTLYIAQLAADVENFVGDRDKAERIHLENLEAHRRSLPADHPTIGSTLGSLGSLAFRRGRFDEAAEYHAESLAILKERFAPDHPQVLNSLSNLATCYVRAERHGEAVPIFEQLVDLERRAFGESHDYIANDLVELGRALLAIDRAADAEAAFREALEIKRELYPEDHENHWNVAWVQDYLARCLADLGRTEDAREVMTEAHAQFEAKFGMTDRRTRSARSFLDSLDDE